LPGSVARSSIRESEHCLKKSLAPFWVVAYRDHRQTMPEPIWLSSYGAHVAVIWPVAQTRVSVSTRDVGDKGPQGRSVVFFVGRDEFDAHPSCVLGRDAAGYSRVGLCSTGVDHFV